MKKWISYFLVACVLCTTLLSFTACNTSEDEITVWVGGSVVGEDEIEQSQDTWIVNQLLKEYAEANGIQIRFTYYEDEEAMVNLIANNGRNGNEVPDIACVYSSAMLREMADVVYPVTEYISDEEKANIMFWETVSDNGKGIDEANEIYGYPFGGTEVTFIAYNKEIFAEAGIDIENNAPKSFEDFEEICAALLAHGVTPIVASDDGWNELYLQVFAKEWVQYTGDAAIVAASNGELSFSDDDALINSLATANEFYEKGYINQDYATNADAATLFANGQGAMFSCSNYDLNMFAELMGENMGVFALPDYEGDVVYSNISFGGCNQCLSTFENSEHKEEAIEIIKWLTNKENTIRLVQKFGCFPNRSDISVAEYDDDPSEIVEAIFPLLPYAHSTPDYLMSLQLCTEFYRYSLLSVIGEITPDECTAQMDAIVNGT